MVSILFDYLTEKFTPPLTRVEKNLFEIVRKWYQKKRYCELVYKRCRTLMLKEREKFFPEK
jgi:hypothetical protein